MAAQKLDINVQRLLRQCETIASEYTNEKANTNWRLEKVSKLFLFQTTKEIFLKRVVLPNNI